MRGYDPSRLLLRGNTHRRALGQQSRGEALSLGEAFDFERDRIDRLRKRGDISVEADVCRRENFLGGLPGRAPRTELRASPRRDKPNEGGKAAGNAEQNYVMLAQGSEEDRRNH